MYNVYHCQLNLYLESHLIILNLCDEQGEAADNELLGGPSESAICLETVSTSIFS